MGLTTKLNTLLKNPLVETIINLIKKLKSSKSYWSVSYLLIGLIVREAIAIKWGDKIESIAQSNLQNPSIEWYEKIFWYTIEFFFVNGAIWLLILLVFIFLVLSVVQTKTTDSNKIIEIVKEEAKNTQTDLDEIKNLIKLQGGDETAFLKKYFGSDYKKVLENPQTYHNLKEKLQENEGSIETLIEEKEELQKKIESRRLHSNGVQKMIDKAFEELRFDDVLDLLDNFIKNNKELEKDLLNAHYQKALAYMEKIEYHEAKEEFETYISIGIKDTNILHDYGTMYYKLGEYDNYLQINTKRLNLLLQAPHEDRTEIATAYNEIGVVWEKKGDSDKAIEFYNKSLNITLATLGENHPSTATTYNNIGLAWDSKGDYDKAIEFYTKALNIRLSTLRENDPEIGTTYNNIGVVWAHKGDYDKAIEFYTKDLNITLAVLGENHPNTAGSYNNIGSVWANKGDYDKAIELYTKAIKIRLFIRGENHPYTAIIYHNIADAWNNKGRIDKAMKFYTKAYKIFKTSLGEEHPHTKIVKGNIKYLEKNCNHSAPQMPILWDLKF